MLIHKATKASNTAQRALYEKYAPKMLALCRRYVRDLQYAEDTMQQGFLKVFLRLETFRGEGSFEGWVKRIMVRECLSFLKNHRPFLLDTAMQKLEVPEKQGVLMKTDADYLLQLINELPEHYRLVFMLHAIEGYRHTEIAKTLGIPKNTSKTKLSKARKILQRKLEIHRKKYETF